ncbi:MAG: calcium-binding protein [Nostoc sp. EfeVER01]|uniref:calcium-binding protein n=1 Tax=unclassified Nostoc TaxID=2593658 RepID=UPI002AD20288|nr:MULTISPECIES: calcium-binding protein [unclassified Nostoc]MDZ7945258.1 calcium-binding protein [Nostoc sp. EfeVER01]MDZ7995302.1 calcium-binding protein [Nostoc sp. EspVER01]
MASINGTLGNDNLIGTLENDSIFGDLGDDILDGGGGGGDEFVFNNVIDVLVFDRGLYVYSTDGFDIIKNFSQTGNSVDDSVISIDPVNHNQNHVNITTFTVAPAPDVFRSGETESIYGTTGSDTIQGTSADEIIYGLEGNDVLYGNDGYDMLYGDFGNDSLDGGANADELYGGLGNDYLNGGEDKGGNVLYGEEGNDILDGGEGLDTLIGGTGNDTYITFAFGNQVHSEDNVSLAPLTLIDKIKEYLNEGTDTVESSFSYKLGDNLENLVLTGSKNINGIGNALDNRIEGNVGHNFLVGDDGNDYLLGYGDYDILVGGAGNDTLEGGAGNDFLNGGSGSDTLVGAAGNNTLTGDTGADTFVFNFRFQGIDIIKDFSYTQSDKIQISTIGFSATSTNEFTYNSNTGALSFQGTEFATLENKPYFIPSLEIELVSDGLTSSISLVL